MLGDYKIRAILYIFRVYFLSQNKKENFIIMFVHILSVFLDEQTVLKHPE